MTPRRTLFMVAAALPLIVDGCLADEGEDEDATRMHATEQAIADPTDPDGDPDAVFIGFDQFWLHHVEQGWIGFTTATGFVNLLEPLSLIGTLQLVPLPEGGFDGIILHVTNAGVVVHGDIYLPMQLELVDRLGLVVDVRFCVQGGDVQGLPSDWNAEEYVHYAEVGYWLEGEIEVEGASVCAADFVLERPPAPPPI